MGFNLGFKGLSLISKADFCEHKDDHWLLRFGGCAAPRAPGHQALQFLCMFANQILTNCLNMSVCLSTVPGKVATTHTEDGHKQDT